MALLPLLCLFRAMGQTQGRGWIDSTLSAMTMEEKVGQLFMADLVAVYSHRESAVRRYALELIRKYHVGGFTLAGGDVSDIALLTNTLQRASKIPLLVNADLENGLGFSHGWQYARGRGPELPPHVPGGGTFFTSMMGVGATGDPRFAYQLGFIIAQEARAVGIHWSNSPVADVNNNPLNPIINTRSFGEDPAKVARFVEACVRGLQEGGVIATLKHFPGHGDTEEDTHMKLPVLPFDEQRLMSVEFVPFKAGISAGARAVMTAHIALPRIDPKGLPATLSPPILNGLLREKLGFGGLVITDGMTMQGVTDMFDAAEAAVMAIEAGADCILVPADFEKAYGGLLAALHSSRLSVRRLDTSVRRLLEAKSWLGLDRQRLVDIQRIDSIVGSPASASVAQAIAEASTTLLKNSRGLIPLKEPSRISVLAVSVEQNAASGMGLQEVLLTRMTNVSLLRAWDDMSTVRIQRILDELGGSDVVVLCLYLSIGAWAGPLDFPGSLHQFLGRVAELKKPMIAVAFGDPYVLAKIPATDAVIAAYSGLSGSEEAVGRVLLGAIDCSGKLPVTIPGFARAGDGLSLPRRNHSTGQ